MPTGIRSNTVEGSSCEGCLGSAENKIKIEIYAQNIIVQINVTGYDLCLIFLIWIKALIR